MNSLPHPNLVAGIHVRIFVWATVMVVAVGFAACTNDRSAPAGPPGDRTPGAIGGPAGRFVGSETCRRCHAGEYEAWIASRHRSTLRPWTPGEPLRLASATGFAPYSVRGDGSISGPGTDGRELKGKVAFLMGGRHREDALVRLEDGRVQVFPISYDADRGEAFEPLKELAGGTSPPPDVIEFWTRAGRNADLACYGCHATGQVIDVVGRSPSGLVLPGSRWVEPGVGCEACHGPGGPHVDAAAAGKPGRDTVRMPRGGGFETIEACAACHGLRDVLPSPFGAVPAHRYGESLVVAAEPLISMGSNSEFRNPFFPDLRPSTYQQEAIAFSQSGCARRGGMTCAACHDVHSGSPSAAIAGEDGGTVVCAPCHADVIASGAKHTLHRAGSPGGRCIDCHLAPILRGPGHEPARDHSMAPPVAGRGQVPAACAACHAGAKNAALVALGWKKMPEGHAAKRRMAIGAAVDAATAETGATAANAAALARLADDTEGGWFLRWAMLQMLPAGLSVPAPDDVLAPVRRALTDPNPALRRAAARALGRCGAASDIETLQRATDDTDPWTALEAVHAMGLLGSPAAGARLLQLVKRPDLIAEARAQYQFGHACLVGQDAPRAETALRRALELNPMIVPAMNDLGLALIAQRKRDAAIAEWTLALDINPRFSAARRNLDAAKP
jgi:predicted CXXCH cytochrome family protein